MNLFYILAHDGNIGVIFDQLFSLLLHRLHGMLEGPTVAVPVWWIFTERTPFVYKVSKCYDDCCCEVQHPQHSGFISGLSVLNSWGGGVYWGSHHRAKSLGMHTTGHKRCLLLWGAASPALSDRLAKGVSCIHVQGSQPANLSIWRPLSYPIAWSQVPRLKFYKERTTACFRGGRVQ